MNYLERVRQRLPDKSDLEIEQMLAQTPGVEKKTGLTQHQHRMNAMRLLFPDRVPIEWWERKAFTVDHARRNRIQEVGWSGSSNCVAGDTRIPDALTGASISIRELCETGVAPVVQTLHGPVLASVPFLKGIADLYEVIMEDGSRFTATLNHRVLSPDGYVFVGDCRAGCELLAYDASRLPSILGTGPSVQTSGARSSSRRAEGCPASYLTGCRLCDAQLLPVAEDGQSFAPSPLCAQICNRCACALRDALASGSGHTHALKSPVPLSSDHSFLGTQTSGMADLLPAFSGMRESWKPFPRSSERSAEEKLQRGPCPEPVGRGFHRGEQGRCDDQHEVLQAFQIVHPVRIVSISKTRPNEEFYDLSVPVAHHYFAEGTIHHNSIKTSGLADIALTYWWENPSATSIYIASPYKHATQTNLWARIVEQFNIAKELHRDLPGRLIASQGKIVQYERNPLSFIQVGTVDEVGKLVGKKSQNVNTGLFLLIIDEAPNLPNGGEEMIAVLDNLLSVQNFLLLYAGNFADPGDFMGRMAEPVGGYDSIKGQEDTLREYRTKRKGIVHRFDGHDSENFRKGRDDYPFVCTMAYAEHIATISGGTGSPGYMRFIRSFPVLDVSEFRVTNSAKIEAGYAEQPAHFDAGGLIHVSFLDAGFGGDAAVIQDLRIGVELRDGRRRQVCELDGLPIIVPIDLNKKEDGLPVTASDQQAIFWKAHIERKGIPLRNCGFDSSLRPGFTHTVAKVMGFDVIPLDPQGGPSDRVFDAQNKKLWRDEVFNFASETWFAVGLLIQSGQLRGLQNSPAAKEQLCARPWLWKGDRKQIQTKDIFKKSHQGKSPNEADALCGGVEIARRRGFNVEVLAGQGAGMLAKLREIYAERKQRAEVKRLLGGNALPPGKLHGIQNSPTHGRRRLHS